MFFFNLRFLLHHNISNKILVSCPGWEGFGYTEVLKEWPVLFDEGVIEYNLWGAGLGNDCRSQANQHPAFYLPFYVWWEHLRSAVLAHFTVHQGISCSHMREMSWLCSPEVKAYCPGLWQHNFLSASVNALCLPFGIGVFSFTLPSRLILAAPSRIACVSVHGLSHSGAKDTDWEVAL